MDIQKMLGYALVGGVGFALGYAIFFKPEEVVSPEAEGAPTPSRWTSDYHGLVNGFPGAGVAEKLYPHGEYHKMTGYSPYATTAGTSNGTNESMVYID